MKGFAFSLMAAAVLAAGAANAQQTRLWADGEGSAPIFEAAFGIGSCLQSGTMSSVASLPLVRLFRYRNTANHKCRILSACSKKLRLDATIIARELISPLSIRPAGAAMGKPGTINSDEVCFYSR